MSFNTLISYNTAKTDLLNLGATVLNDSSVILLFDSFYNKPNSTMIIGYKLESQKFDNNWNAVGGKSIVLDDECASEQGCYYSSVTSPIIVSYNDNYAVITDNYAYDNNSRYLYSPQGNVLAKVFDNQNQLLSTHNIFSYDTKKTTLLSLGAAVLNDSSVILLFDSFYNKPNSSMIIGHKIESQKFDNNWATVGDKSVILDDECASEQGCYYSSVTSPVIVSYNDSYAVIADNYAYDNNNRYFYSPQGNVLAKVFDNQNQLLSTHNIFSYDTKKTTLLSLGTTVLNDSSVILLFDSFYNKPNSSIIIGYKIESQKFDNNWATGGGKSVILDDECAFGQTCYYSSVTSPKIVSHDNSYAVVVDNYTYDDNMHFYSPQGLIMYSTQGLISSTTPATSEGHSVFDPTFETMALISIGAATLLLCDLV